MLDINMLTCVQYLFSYASVILILSIHHAHHAHTSSHTSIHHYHFLYMLSTNTHNHHVNYSMHMSVSLNSRANDRALTSCCNVIYTVLIHPFHFTYYFIILVHTFSYIHYILSTCHFSDRLQTEIAVFFLQKLAAGPKHLLKRVKRLDAQM